MAEPARWEYRAVTIGSYWTEQKDEEVEAALNELGAEGWEIVAVVPMQGGNRVRAYARRPLSLAARRQRSLPSIFP